MRTMTIPPLVLSVLLSAALWSGAARGADPLAGDPDAMFARAKGAFETGHYEEAYAIYTALWAVRQTYDIAANLAQVELELGKKAEAAGHLVYALRAFPMSSSKESKAAMKRALAGLRKELGTVRIAVGVDGAEVMIDGRPVGKAPLGEEVFVVPGRRVIEAKLGGYRDAREAIEAKAGESASVVLTLARSEAMKESGAGAQTGVGAPSGSERNGQDAGAGEGGPRTALLIEGGASAGAALVAGVIFTVVANGKAGDTETQRAALVKGGGAAACAGSTPACEELLSSVDAKDMFTTAAVWSFVGAGVLGAATGIYALVSPKAEGVAGPRASPIVTAHGGRIVVSGAW